MFDESKANNLQPSVGKCCKPSQTKVEFLSLTCDDKNWDAGYGGCWTYAESQRNFDRCEEDGAMVHCHNACTGLIEGVDCCSDSPTFNAGFGKCGTYAEGARNHAKCEADGATEFCPVACNVCDQKFYNATATAATPCEDATGEVSTYGDCESYSPKGSNHKYCVQDKVEDLCPMACGKCEGGGGVIEICDDTGDDCEMYLPGGSMHDQCDATGISNCPIACGLCEGTPSFETVPPPDTTLSPPSPETTTPPEPQFKECEAHNECEPGYYCDTTYTCYQCDYFDQLMGDTFGPLTSDSPFAYVRGMTRRYLQVPETMCDAVDDDCCSTDFVMQCSNDPFWRSCGGEGSTDNSDPIKEECLEDVPPSRIVGGVDAKKREFKFIASLQDPDFGGHFCGGSLIADKWVLTAAHCVEEGAPSKIVMGMHKTMNGNGKGGNDACEEHIPVKKVIIHPSYGNPDEMINDIALIELTRPSAYPPIDLNHFEKNELPTHSLMVSGWGTTEQGGSAPDILQKVEVPVQDTEKCLENYGGGVFESNICAGFNEGGKDSCQGDSGGPLFEWNPPLNPQLVGVVSWGYGCAQPDYYGVYARVSSYSEWIKQATDGDVIAKPWQTATPVGSPTPVPTPGIRPNCMDGLMNGEEEGVDCGGVCEPCHAPCADSISWTDNSGAKCSAFAVGAIDSKHAECLTDPDARLHCPKACAQCDTEGCEDGIQNGNEDGIDCGGSCEPCFSDAQCLDRTPQPYDNFLGLHTSTDSAFYGRPVVPQDPEVQALEVPMDTKSNGKDCRGVLVGDRFFLTLSICRDATSVVFSEKAKCEETVDVIDVIEGDFVTQVASVVLLELETKPMRHKPVRVSGIGGLPDSLLDPGFPLMSIGDNSVVKFPVTEKMKCSEKFGSMLETQLCVGYDVIAPEIELCNGKYGNPLVFVENSEPWLAGISISMPFVGCSAANYGIIHKATALLKWMCDSGVGECLPEVIDGDNEDIVVTNHGCKCADVWVADSACPNSGVQTYCNMVEPCDGDTGGVAGQSWCKTTSECLFEVDGEIVSHNWDYCFPPGSQPTDPTDPTDPNTPSECYLSPDRTEYTGTVSVTNAGAECAPWADFDMDAESNYCRNPDADTGPWCFTVDINLGWGYCNVGTHENPICENGETEPPTSGSSSDPSTPTCTDGLFNGDEEGVDCGEVCGVDCDGTSGETSGEISGETSGSCSDHSDCAVESYCDSTSTCYACWYIAQGNDCDSFDNNCASDQFRKNCPGASQAPSRSPTPPTTAPTAGVLPATCKSKMVQRIVGGSDAGDREFPFIVSLQTADGFPFCGGSIINKNMVLTAAHCAVEMTANSDRAVIGLHKQSEIDECVDIITVKKIISHPQYDSNTLENDIAILVLEGDTRYDFSIGLATEEIADFEQITVAGWGTLQSQGSAPDTLQKVTVPKQPFQACFDQYIGDGIVIKKDVMICAGDVNGGKDSCQGDSGGPFFTGFGTQFVQHGVVSFGIGCADKNYFGVYAKVAHYAGPGKWICATIDDDHPSCENSA